MQFKHIMFVCTANICRSPMAQYLLEHHPLVQSLSLSIQSSGLSASRLGHSANAPVRELLNHDGIDTSAHLARQIDATMVAQSDLILVMENHHRQEVIRRFPEARSKVYLLGHHDQHEIKDPYRQGIDVFQTVKLDIEKGLDQWVNTLLSL